MKRSIAWLLLIILLVTAIHALGDGELRGYDSKDGYVYVTFGEYPQVIDGGTPDDKYQAGTWRKHFRDHQAKGVLCEEGLDPAVDEILDLVRENDLILCSGHIAPEETLALFKRAQEKGLRKLIATHVEWPPTGASLELQKEFVACGAYLEHCVINLIGGSLRVEDLAAQVSEIGAEHMILSTDLGQVSNPEPVAAFREYAQRLLKAGVTRDELRLMIEANPANLLGGNR